MLPRDPPVSTHDAPKGWLLSHFAASATVEKEFIETDVIYWGALTQSEAKPDIEGCAHRWNAELLVFCLALLRGFDHILARSNDLEYPMTVAEYEAMLTRLCESLNAELARGLPWTQSKQFENRVREVVRELVAGQNLEIDFAPHPYVFPDIVMGKFGIEVKFTTNDTWRSVANSVFESTREEGVRHIYVVFGKMGGVPAVSWGRYEESVIHVRTSHVPRFEVEVPPPDQQDERRESLFVQFGITYEQFSSLDLHQKMEHIRSYARGRLKRGERLWWIEDLPEQGRGLPLQVRLYMRLEQSEKRRLRAEAALLCPQICGGSRTRDKYNDAVMYILTYHGVLCPQARDLFSAGSVALRADNTRGGNYILRALQDIEAEMRTAAQRLEPALFQEYWGVPTPPERRIQEWLSRADAVAREWVPSEHLFLT